MNTGAPKKRAYIYIYLIILIYKRVFIFLFVSLIPLLGGSVRLAVWFLKCVFFFRYIGRPETSRPAWPQGKHQSLSSPQSVTPVDTCYNSHLINGDISWILNTATTLQCNLTKFAAAWPCENYLSYPITCVTKATEAWRNTSTLKSWRSGTNCANNERGKNT